MYQLDTGGTVLDTGQLLLIRTKPVQYTDLQPPECAVPLRTRCATNPYFIGHGPLLINCTERCPAWLPWPPDLPYTVGLTLIIDKCTQSGTAPRSLAP